MVSDDELVDASFFPRLELDTSDCESQKDVNIGPINLDGLVYCHQGPSYAVSVQDQPHKVNSGTPEAVFSVQASACVP